MPTLEPALIVRLPDDKQLPAQQPTTQANVPNPSQRLTIGACAAIAAEAFPTNSELAHHGALGLLRLGWDRVPRTQKARGYLALGALANAGYIEAQYIMPAFKLAFPATAILLDCADPTSIPKQWPLFPQFARPCPMVPRHGFVDSHIVETPAQVLDMINATATVDAQGEVIVAPPIAALWSAIVTNNTLTIGHKNAGATSGQGITFPFPTAADHMSKLWAYFTNEWIAARTMMLAGIKETPYTELVVEQTGLKRPQVHQVQLRDGPAQPTTEHFIPRKETVQRALTVSSATQDLLAWESLVRLHAKDKPGVCLWLPGQGLASHYAVHGIANNVMVWTGADDPTGRTFDPADYTAIPQPTPEQLRALAEYAIEYASLPIPVSAKLAAAALGWFHASPIWPWQDAHIRCRAFMLSALLKTCAATCAGETRHGHYGHSDPVRAWFNGRRAKDRPYARAIIYQQVSEHGIRDLRSLLECCVQAFDKGGFRGSFGGKPWLRASAAGVGLASALQSLTHGAQDAKQWQRVLAAANKVANAVHNNGALLTKFLSTSDMFKCATNPVFGMLSPFLPYVTFGDTAGLIRAAKFGQEDKKT